MDQVLELSFMAKGNTATAKKVTVMKLKNPDVTLTQDMVYQAMLKLADLLFLVNAKGESVTLGTPYMAQLASTNKKTLFEMTQKLA
ncbi:MAG: hypothetical protein ACTIMJ_03045 [Weissella hellenica]|uniref:hypothetical protein n=1 Tax=Weissella hellenica TaxID=46256 RepID=UPI003883C50D